MVEKVQCLMKFCKENYIRLQMSKCAVMCINSERDEDHDSLQIQNLELKSTICEVYLGSSITNSFKLIDDVNADLKNKWNEADHPG